MKPYAGYRSPKLSTQDPSGGSRAATRGAKETVRNAKRALNKRGRRVEKEPPEKLLTEYLYNADPNCDHERDPNCYNGIKCRKCPGWFCY